MAFNDQVGRVGKGVATNTIGTIGNSIFNSTIGTFTDKDEMNQLYKALDRLGSPIESITNGFDSESVVGRNKIDSIYTTLSSLKITDVRDFMNKNREFMKRLMKLNKQERDITLNALGSNITGESNTVKSDQVREYNHVKGNNYYEDYVKTIRQNQEIGDETTMMQLSSNNHFNYSGLHNELYTVSQNLYPDDKNQGTFSNKWITENKNSLMSKMKTLWNQNKVNTIISRFHTDPNKPNSTLDNAKSKYGLSHGRNLLTKQAELGYNTKSANGYDNPYCRVWTHHHQYDRYYKTIRPFSTVDDNENYEGTIGVAEFHNWGQFSDKKDTTTNGQWGWKKDNNNGWKYSVLQDNGMPNITPKYISGEASNLHTKQCMFSIENLAWRGYDPYSFEQALSWEQRGPLGGRIMWFPPYGISFSESVSTDWNSHTFIGRGEDVYTYTKTRRTGNLRFMLVVDHPSILDYVTWSGANKDVTDTDILRFLAGCGEGSGGGSNGHNNGNNDPNNPNGGPNGSGGNSSYGGNGPGGPGGIGGLRDLAKPTPLTDEYVQVPPEVEGIIAPPKEPEKPAEPEPPAPIEKNGKKYLCFYVFYPNNYSGTYDDPRGSDAVGRHIDGTSQVEAIPYLLAGSGPQKQGSDYSTPFAGDIPLNEATNYVNATGNGYEMKRGGGLGKGNGYIVGTSKYQNILGKNGRRYWTGLGSKGNPRTGKYIVGLADPKMCKKWYYRIDGRYALPKSTQEEKIHYYNQKLVDKASYIDTTSFGLNQDIEIVAKNLDSEITKNEDGTYSLKDHDNSEVFTLAEMAYVLYDGKVDILKGKTGITENERTKRIREILSDETKTKYITAVIGEGYASAHGYTETNQELGKNRALTALSWFVDRAEISNKIPLRGVSYSRDKVKNGIGDKDSTDIEAKNLKWVRADKGGEDSEHTKKWRHARVLIEIDETEKKTVETLDTKPKDAKADVVQNTGTVDSLVFTPTGEKVNGKDIYLDKKTGRKWYLKNVPGKSAPTFVLLDGYAAEEDKTPTLRYGKGKTDENRLRYDQEYHFFKVLKQTDPTVFNSLMDKLQYFDPAFHSMTPEGFNGRLTFLQQCMRQGNSVGASDGKFTKGANNMAFGRSPYCVLRLGDFYNQMIVIDNMTIDYDPLVWDLNVEGAGVQPLIANVNLSFTFIGGGDLTGPIRRLQNACSFNFYSGTRLYDNRADRAERYWSDKTNGALQHDEILDDDYLDKSEEFKKTYNGNLPSTVGSQRTSEFYTTKMFK